MPDFDDIPELPARAEASRTLPNATPWVRLHGSPPTRAEVGKRRRMAVAVSVAWIAVQFFAFGVRGDLNRLPLSYVLFLILIPLVAGFAALVVSLRSGSLGLGSKTALVSVLALLGPLGFMLAGLLVPAPYEHGETGGLMFGAYCMNCTVAWALLPIAAAALSLRGAFAAGAVWRSTLLGAGCGLVAAALFTLHCPVVGKLHIALAHGGAVLISAVIGGFCLSWSTRS